ncbi:MAG: DUF4389 domain-containing protein [Candidatus Micrarchaeota archaeon]|nr:DUF4389 domain-containing protein [Candidatus Micrarchaeota archaeon]
MDSIKISVKSDEKASRIELFIRFVWYFIAMIILGIIGIFAYIAVMLQWLHILILAKRHPALGKFVNSWYTAVAQLIFYILLATDERPPLMPEF